MNAPDLNKNGLFDFDDFSRLFDEYYANGLPFGDPVLPEEWQFISGEAPVAHAAGVDGAAGAAMPPVPEHDSETSTAGMLDTERSVPGQHRENREKVEKLKKRLGATGFDLQEELAKLERAQAAEDEAAESELDPRYRGLPELFEERIFQKKSSSSSGQSGNAGMMTPNTNTTNKPR